MIFNGHGAVWDAENNKVLAEFEDGKFETTDKAVIEKMKKAGFEPETKGTAASNE